MDQTADLTTAGFARWGESNKRERNFWIALACAAVLHASLFIGAVNSKTKRLGDENGADNAISVSLVTEADLESRATVAEEPQPPPGPPPQPAQQPQPQQPPPQPEAKQEPQPPEPEPPKPEQQETKAEPAPQPEDVKPAEKPELKASKQEDPDPIDDASDLLSLQNENPANVKSAEKPKPKPKAETETPRAAPKPAPKKPQKKVASLDLSTPKNLMQPSFGGGRSAGLQRPPGITRSGLNDAFARGVIRALQQTMPQLVDINGRVTIRILLSETGNVVEVRLLSGAKNSTLNQDVVFAAQQTSYPIPPTGSNLADRTFMVTYIYD